MRTNKEFTLAGEQSAEERFSEIKQILVKKITPQLKALSIRRALAGFIVPAAVTFPANAAEFDLVAATHMQKLSLLTALNQRPLSVPAFILCCMYIAFPEAANIVFEEYKTRRVA